MIDPELGYDPDDQFFYTPGLVRELLPMALTGPVPPARGLAEQSSTPGDPATGGNLQAMILDVRRALALRPGTKGAAIAALRHGDDIPAFVLHELVNALGGPKA